MKLRKTLFVALCAATLGSIAVPMSAGAQVRVYYDTAPPAPRHEAIPAARQGYVWSPGYWNAKGRRHVWQAGHWERQRNGYHLTQPAWVQRNDRWELERGRWNRGDRDHDGVPNAVDRAPDNPAWR